MYTTHGGAYHDRLRSRRLWYWASAELDCRWWSRCGYWTDRPRRSTVTRYRRDLAGDLACL